MWLLLVKRSSMSLSSWNSSMMFFHLMFVSMGGMVLLVSHSLVVHVTWLSIHLRMASGMMLWVCISIWSLLSLMSRVMSFHLTMMRFHSVHAVESLALLLLLLLLHNSLLNLSFLCSLHSSFLLSSQIFLSFIFSLINHITDLSKMINLGVSTVILIVFVSRLHEFISLFLLRELLLLFNLLLSILLSLLVRLGRDFGLVFAQVSSLYLFEDIVDDV